MSHHAWVVFSWTGWIIGAALVVLGLVNAVPDVVGWVGMAVAALAVLAYLSRGPAIVWDDGNARLNKRMVLKRNGYYWATLEHLKTGGIVIWSVTPTEEVALSAKIPQDLNCVIAANRPPEEVSERRAQTLAIRAHSSVNMLSKLSPEMADFTATRRLVITIITMFGPQAVILCSELGGTIYWVWRTGAEKSACSSSGAA